MHTKLIIEQSEVVQQYHSVKNQCPKFTHCSAAFCPATQQGLHVEGDSICTRLPLFFRKGFSKNFKEASAGEIMAAVTRAFDSSSHPAPA